MSAPSPRLARAAAGGGLTVAVLAVAATAHAGPTPVPPAAGDAPRPAAAAWILAAPGRGGVLLAHAADAERPVASLTKLMTAHLVLQTGRLGGLVRIGGDAPATGESSVGLRAGEQQTRLALLEALVVRSANDAAVALADAEAGGEEAFVRRMNAEARRLGLRHTAYRTPHGLDAPGQHSSARDVLRLSLLDMANPVFRRLAGSRRAAIPGHPSFRTRNSLLGAYAGLDGIKTGHTSGAGWNLAATASRDGVRLVCIVLGSPAQARRDRDVTRLLDWGFDRFHRVDLVRRGASYGTLAVPYGGGRVRVVAARSLARITREGVRYGERVVLPDLASPPLRRGQRVGTVTLVASGGRVVGSVPLVTASAVPARTNADRARWVLRRALGTLAGWL